MKMEDIDFSQEQNNPTKIERDDYDIEQYNEEWMDEQEDE